MATKDEPRKSLPDGLILTLIFEVKPNAVPKTVVPLKIEQVNASDTDNPPRVLNGSVDKKRLDRGHPSGGSPDHAVFFLFPLTGLTRDNALELRRLFAKTFSIRETGENLQGVL